jgi:hypothetical protein
MKMNYLLLFGILGLVLLAGCDAINSAKNALTGATSAIRTASDSLCEAYTTQQTCDIAINCKWLASDTPKCVTK